MPSAGAGRAGDAARVVPHGNRIELKLDRGSAELVWITPSTFRFRRVLEGPLRASAEDARRAPWRYDVTIPPAGCDCASKFIEVTLREAGLAGAGAQARRHAADDRPDANRASEAGGVVWERAGAAGRAHFTAWARAPTRYSTCAARACEPESPFLYLARAATASIIPAPGTYRFDFTATTGTGSRRRRSTTTSITGPLSSRSSKSTTRHAGPAGARGRRQRTASGRGRRCGRRCCGSCTARCRRRIAPMFDLAAYDTAPPELQQRARQLGSLVARGLAGDSRAQRLPQAARYASSAATRRVAGSRAFRSGIRCRCSSRTTASARSTRTNSCWATRCWSRRSYEPGGQRSVYLPRGNWTNLETNETDSGTAHDHGGNGVAAGVRAQRRDRAAGCAGRHGAALFPEGWAASSSCWRATSPNTRRFTRRRRWTIMRLEIESKKDRDYQWVVHHVDTAGQRGVRGYEVRRGGGIRRAGRPHLVLRCGAEELARPGESEGGRGLYR